MAQTTGFALIEKIETEALIEFHRTLLEDYSIHMKFKSFCEIKNISEESRLKSNFKDFIISIATDIIYKLFEKLCLSDKEYTEMMSCLNISKIITTKKYDVQLALVQKLIFNRMRT